ncbi:MAG: outer membrane lipoprotein carrier protein LolA [Myxococcota bacterium]
MLALVAADSADEAGRTLDAVQKRYDGVRDLRASFEQTSFSVALGAETVSRGTVTVERPGKMRWEYAAPDGRVIVLDTDAIKIWNPDEKQLQIAPLSAGNVSPTALGFLLGQGVLRETFDAELIAAPERAERGLRLRPKSDGGFELLELWVDPKTHELRESVVLDLFGNRTRLRLSELRENSGVAPSEFEFEAPAGAEVVDLR